MFATSTKPPQQLLDEVHTPASLARFSVDGFARAVAEGHAGDPIDPRGLAATDDALRATLGAIDRFIAKVTKVALDVALADDNALPQAFRTNLAATVLRYQDERELLRDRVRQTALRTAPPLAEALAATVGDVVDGSLGLRGALYDAVIDLARSRAQAALPEATARAIDRQLDDSARAAWSCAEQELRALVAAPQRLVREAWAIRVARHEAVALPELAEPSFGSLIELD